jgi:hypothetical protein
MQPFLPTPPEVTIFPKLDSDHSADEFVKIQHELCDQQYWELLRWVWIRHGGSVSRLKAQKQLLMAQRPQKEYLMTANERQALAKLPDELTVYHGTSLDAEQLGWSWSVDYYSSLNFARKRFDGPRVVRGRCSKVDVVAYFPEYDEEEIVIDPDRVRNKYSLVRDELFDYKP